MRPSWWTQPAENDTLKVQKHRKGVFIILTVNTISGTGRIPIAFFLVLLFELAIFAGFIYLFILVVKALRVYIRSNGTRKETAAVRRSLGETLKEYRTRGNMTQEFVAEQLGISRQAVSKWENGTSDPSTSNLLALAKLYGVSAEELLRNIEV